MGQRIDAWLRKVGWLPELYSDGGGNMSDRESQLKEGLERIATAFCLADCPAGEIARNTLATVFPEGGAPASDPENVGTSDANVGRGVPTDDPVAEIRAWLAESERIGEALTEPGKQRQDTEAMRHVRTLLNALETERKELTEANREWLGISIGHDKEIARLNEDLADAGDIELDLRTRLTLATGCLEESRDKATFVLDLMNAGFADDREDDVRTALGQIRAAAQRTLERITGEEPE